MALADAIFSRWDGLSERLPHRLEDLRGPHEGVVVLPVHLTWHGLREFDVSRVESRLVLYSILLGQGRRADLVRFVSAQRLAEDWPALAGLLGERAPGLRAPAGLVICEIAPICQAGPMRKYVIMGVQGSGKGTQSQMLARDFDLVHISVGDIFRWNVVNHTKMGAQVRRIMAEGQLVGDDMAESVVRDRLTRHDWNYGFIIDGFPRNRRQAEFFLEGYDIDGVIDLDMPDSEVRRRVLARRLCSSCGMDYNLLANTPAEPGKCDVCGGELITREDDTEEALAVRLKDFHEKTNPVLDLFRRKEYVITVDARAPKRIVQQEIRGKLGLPLLPGEDNVAEDSGAQGHGAEGKRGHR